MTKVFLYARKSTDEEDRQVLSLESQLRELHEFAKKESLSIIQEFIESKTAKVPGRPIFNQMMAQLEHGNVEGILAWHPDRLARNSVDGGQLIYLLDTGKLQTLKFPNFWFDNTPQGKFMLNIAFGQSKYYVDNLRENILRGIRQKLHRGEFPGKPPLGYTNEPKLRTIVLDQEKATFVRQMFEAYSTGGHTLQSLRNLTITWGLKTHFNKPIARSKIREVLSNPFFTGQFYHKGELYQGSHEPIISKALFDQVQSILHNRKKPNQKRKHHFALLGLLTCAECECAITAERQKGHHYYRCTKKRGKCNQPFVREEKLAEYLRQIVAQVALPTEWREPIFNQLDIWRQEEVQNYQSAKNNFDAQLNELDLKLERLLDIHLDGAITRDEYTRRKEKHLKEKLAIQDKLTKLADQGSVWLEPARSLLHVGFAARELERDENLESLAGFFKNVGSNLRLADRAPSLAWKKPWSILCEKINFYKAFLLVEPKINFQPDSLISWSIFVEFSRFSGWWRRRDSNPRPKRFKKKALQV